MRPFQLNVVLVRTIYDSNIGATSRAMSNMGAKNLILIDRKCEITFQTQQAAASGQEGLQNRREYDSWKEFFKQEADGLRLAFSARDGRTRPVWDIGKIFDWIKLEHPEMRQDWDGSKASVLPVYLIFGPEDWGLSNEDLALTHFNVNIPTFGENSSLNLAQAVLLALYTLRLHWGGEKTMLDGQQPARQSPSKNVFPEKALYTWLAQMNFDLSKDVNAYSVLKRMLLHNVPTEKELSMLETVLQQSIRKLKEYNELRQIQDLPK